ncbi:hypothetical protein ABPG74_000949 [Tetrahymena malaccensis]
MMQLSGSTSIFYSNSKAVFGNTHLTPERNREQRTEFGNNQIYSNSNIFLTPRSQFYQYSQSEQQQLGYQSIQRSQQQQPKLSQDGFLENQILYSEPSNTPAYFRKQQQADVIAVPQKNQNQYQKQNNIQKNDDLFIDLSQIHNDNSSQPSNLLPFNGHRRSLPTYNSPKFESSFSPFRNQNELLGCNSIQSNNKNSLFVSQGLSTTKQKQFDLLEENKNSPQNRYSNSPAHQIYDQFNQHEARNSNQNTPSRRQMKSPSNENVLSIYKKSLDKENQVGDQLIQQEQKTKPQNNLISSSKTSRARNMNFSSFISDIQDSFNQSQQNQLEEKTESKHNQLILSSQSSKPDNNTTITTASNSPQVKNGSQRSILKPPKERILDFFNELVDATKSPQNKKVTFAL